METRTVTVSCEGADGLTAALPAQIAAITARGGAVVSVQLTSPLAATITDTDGKPPA